MSDYNRAAMRRNEQAKLIARLIERTAYTEPEAWIAILRVMGPEFEREVIEFMEREDAVAHALGDTQYITRRPAVTL